jgi:hypothetical protein
MDAPSASMLDLAQRLLAAEASSKAESDPQVGASIRVCEKLRQSITRFAGVDGFSALFRRALAMARIEAPSLETISVAKDGALEGIEDIPADAAIALVRQVLELLVVFIGHRLTMRFVADAWPDVLLDEPASE